MSLNKFKYVGSCSFSNLLLFSSRSLGSSAQFRKPESETIFVQSSKQTDITHAKKKIEVDGGKRREIEEIILRRLETSVELIFHLFFFVFWHFSLYELKRFFFLFRLLVIRSERKKLGERWVTLAGWRNYKSASINRDELNRLFKRIFVCVHVQRELARFITQPLCMFVGYFMSIYLLYVSHGHSPFRTPYPFWWHYTFVFFVLMSLFLDSK